MAAKAVVVMMMMLPALVIGAPSFLDPNEMSPLQVVCARQELTTLCSLLKVAARDTVVQVLNSQETVATLFAPTDRGFRIAEKARKLSISDLMSDPEAAARFIKEHVLVGETADSRTFRAGIVYKNALKHELEVLEGKKGNIYLRCDMETSKLVRRNLKSKRALVHVIEVPFQPMM